MSKLIRKIPFSAISRLEYIRGKEPAERIGDAYSRLGCDLLINANLFNMTTGEPVGWVVSNGTILSKGYTGYGYAFLDKKTPVFSFENAVGAPDFVGGYSTLVREGKKDISYNLTDKRGRTAMGLAGENLVLCLIADNDGDKCNLDMLAEKMIALGCETAVNLDGGGSTQWQSKKEGSYSSGRALDGFIALWYKKEETHMADVCIDAGHGKNTAGKSSPDGTYQEYEFNRDVAGKIKAHLERCGVSVVLSSPGDEDVPLSKRCEISNTAGAQYFLSIHTDGSGNAWDEASGWSAHIVAKGGNAEKLAEAIRKESIPMLGIPDRGIRVSNFAVLRDTKASAVLVEHGFHTNQDDLEKLKTQVFRAKCAEADARGVLAMLGKAWVPETPTSISIGALAEELKSRGIDKIVL